MSQQPYTATLLRDSQALESLRPELEALARAAAEPNPFYEYWALVPALRNLSQGCDLRHVLIRHADGELAAHFVFEATSRFRSMPVKTLRLWQHPYCFLCTPLIGKAHVRGVLEALLAWLQSDASNATVLEFDKVGADGPIAQALLAELAARPQWEVDQTVIERAAYFPAQQAESAISVKHRRDLRRLERRLGEVGELRYRLLEDEGDVADWIEKFLVIEGRGWKGDQGTALNSDPQSQQFFREMAQGAYGNGSLQMMSLELKGTPIAMKCNFLAAHGSFAFKMAYDEEYFKYSPGIMLEAFNMQHLGQNCPGIQWMDSCALANHPSLNRLWVGRLRIASWAMAHHSLVGRALVRMWPAYRAAKSFARRITSSSPGSSAGSASA